MTNQDIWDTSAEFGVSYNDAKVMLAREERYALREESGAVLIVETAVAYLQSKHDAPLEIVSATAGRIDGEACVIVLFKTADGWTYDATCWLENGHLYGEW